MHGQPNHCSLLGNEKLIYRRETVQRTLSVDSCQMLHECTIARKISLKRLAIGQCHFLLIFVSCKMLSILGRHTSLILYGCVYRVRNVAKSAKLLPRQPSTFLRSSPGRRGVATTTRRSGGRGRSWPARGPVGAVRHAPTVSS